MRTRNSEYQRAYPELDPQYCKDIHAEMLSYRNQRRAMEFAHSKIKWDSDTSSGCSTPSTVDEEQVSHSEQKEDDPMHADDTAESPEQENIIDHENEDVPRINLGKKSTERVALMEVDTELDKPPFVPYGWADKELETARKYTHNVRANKTYVYPSALKRLRLNKSRQSKQKDTHAESRASVAAALKSKQKAQSNDIWMTEYQRCYSQASTSRPCSAISVHTDNNKLSKKRRPNTSSRAMRAATR